jgi:starch synthase (maltosyl-transferring)
VRVVLLVTDLERGGTPLRIARLARDLHDTGVDVTVGCLAPLGPVGQELAAAGLPTFGCGACCAADVLALWRLHRVIGRIRPDLIHATLTHANVAARLVGATRHVPVVTATATIEVQRRWHIAVERLTRNWDRGHIVNSAAVAEHVVRAFRRPPHSVHLIPPSIDPPPTGVDRAAMRAALDLDANEFVVLWVGRLDPVKRLDITVHCLEHMPSAPVRLLIAGDGPDRARLEREIAASANPTAVRMLGWRDDVRELLAAADAFVFPSRTEGMPNAVLEALATGLPVVASDIPALRELCGDEQRLVLVTENTPRAFAAELTRLYEDPAGRQALSARAARWAATHLDPQASIAATLRVYRHVLRQSG